MLTLIVTTYLSTCCGDGGIIGPGTWPPGGGGGGSGAPTTAQYWVGTANGSLPNEKNLGALSTGLVLNTAGTPSQYAGASCPAHQWLDALNVSGAPTCAQINYTDLAGTVPAGGSNSQVQFNSGGTLGGETNVESDGARERFVCESSTPSAPASGKSAQFDFCVGNAGGPQTTQRIDPLLGFPMPIGVLSPASGWLTATMPDMAYRVCHFPDGVGGSTSYGVLEGTTIATSNSGSNHNLGWDAGSQTQKHRWVTKTAGTTAHAWAGVAAGSSDPPIIPSQAFMTWMRWFVPTWDGKTATWLFMGYRNGSSAFVGTTMPSAVQQSFYFGCDNDNSTGSVPLKACSNATTTATCQIIDGGATPFDCRKPGIVYDGWFWASANEGQIHWMVREYLDADAGTNVSSGVLTTNQPIGVGQFTWAHEMNAGDDAGAASVDDFYPGGECHVVTY